MRTRLVVGFVAVALLVGCGGGSSPQRETTGKAQMDCLRGKNLDPKPDPDLAFGVTDKFFRYGAADPDDPQSKVSIFVFDDHDKAVKNRPAITLQTEDDSRNQVVGSTLVDYSKVPSKQFSETVAGCVEKS